MQREAVLAPPVGYRPAIPTKVKLDVVIRQDGRCKSCGERLGVLKDSQFDHVPAIQLRSWDAETKDTIPPANDPEYIQGKHVACHLAKTTGRRGESRKGDKMNGDTPRISKLRRMTEKQAEFQQRILAKDDVQSLPETAPSKKTKWPKRPFPKGQAFKRPNKDGLV